ncbi:hypothetical protein NIES4074_60610 (plasmid) [Cylindrospermum sp. NIES-4074]|nr:hypothetical protein NIES4074_60610 [Cylindrospermum sp. NIES-4074]
MSDRVSFPLLAIVVDTHRGAQNSAPRIDDIVYNLQISKEIPLFNPVNR